VEAERVAVLVVDGEEALGVDVAGQEQRIEEAGELQRRAAVTNTRAQVRWSGPARSLANQRLP
jgi:hypothetical protein